MATRIRLRRGTAAQWTSANPVLGLGERGTETDTGREKSGDGTTAWADLPYFAVPPSEALYPSGNPLTIPDLAGWWRAPETQLVNGSPHTVPDASGMGHPARANTTHEGVLGQVDSARHRAMLQSFFGYAASMMASIPDIPQPFTASWVGMFDALDEQGQLVATNYSSDPSPSCWMELGTDGETVRLVTGDIDHGGASGSFEGGIVSTEDCHVILGVFDGSSSEIWLDCEKVAEGELGPEPLTHPTGGTGPNTIGLFGGGTYPVDDGGSFRFISAQHGETAIWRRHLTEDEIMAYSGYAEAYFG